MAIEILGISGSPIQNSNTDRLVRAMLAATGLESRFVKLSTLNVRPCLACKGCVPDNTCKVKDDFPGLAEDIKEAKALIIGAYTPYGQIDGFTKALLERLWSLRHVNNLLRGKLCATVLTGLSPDALKVVNRAMAAELRIYERMDLLGQVTLRGNLPCLFCGEGDACAMSGLKATHGPGARTADLAYARVEDQHDAWEEALRIASLMAGRIRAAQDRESRIG